MRVDGFDWEPMKAVRSATGRRGAGQQNKQGTRQQPAETTHAGTAPFRAEVARAPMI